MSRERLLLLGFGDIAQRLAECVKGRYDITGVRRSAVNYDGVTTVQADCGDITAMAQLLAPGFDVIVSTMTPATISDEGYDQTYVKTTAALVSGLRRSSHQPRLVILVSSTSVYGQQQGEWVDEHAATDPTSFSGKRLLEAEQYLQNSGYPCCIVRFSGIYGPGRRRLLEQVLAGQGAAAEPVVYSNRIHADDAARVLAYLIDRQRQATIAPLYLASDCDPAPLHQVKHWLAQQLQLPADHLQPQPINRQLRSSKRVNNQLLLASGFEFLYPSYREGYSLLIGEGMEN